MADIRKGDRIQPVAGRRLRDCRAESDPFLQTDVMTGEPVPTIRWSHQASDNDRHWCTGALSSFRKD